MAGDLAEAPGRSKLSAGHCCGYQTLEDAAEVSARLASGRYKKKRLD
jgi:hypothetical protein